MNRTLLNLTIAASLLSACGGGGGGGSGAPPTQPPTAQNGLAFSAANAKPAVIVAYGAATQSLQPGVLVGSSSVTSTGNSDGQKSQSSTVQTQAPQVGPFGPDTTDCDVAGTRTASGNIAGLLGFTTGDQINLDSNDCDDGLGQVVNGRFEMTVESFSGDLLTGIFRLTTAVRLNEFEVAAESATIRSNGDATATIDTTGSPLIVTSVAGSSMTTQIVNTRTDTVSNFESTQTVDISIVPEPYTLTSSGTVDSTELAGTVEYSTPFTFQGSGTDYPFAGELLLTGANGGTIRLIAVDNVNVRIDTDTNGDGAVDIIEFTTWADIDN